ncbi:MAG: hypothetical protein ACODAQ_01500 [Phycisphaeraceae bacterium]
MNRLIQGWWCIALVLVVVGTGSAARAQETASLPEHVTVIDGEVASDDGAWVVNSRFATLRIGADDGANYRARVSIELAATRQPVPVTVAPADPEQPDGPAAMRQRIGRDAEGLRLAVRPYRWNDDEQKWIWERGDQRFQYAYWPHERQAPVLKQLEEDGITGPRTWRQQPLSLHVEVLDTRASTWFEGLLVESRELDAPARGPVLVRLAEGDRLHGAMIEAVASDDRFQAVDLSSLANGRGLSGLAEDGRLKVANVPFQLVRGENDHLNLRTAKWIDQLRDPPSFYSPLDAGPPFLHDQRMPMLRVPKADYVAMHVLAVADDDEQTVPRFTIRAGRYSAGMGQVFQHEFLGEVPVAGAAGAVAQAGDKPVYHVRVPMSLAFAQDVEADYIDMELNREVRLAVRRPDPNRFRYRPLGLPSGVRIAAITLERSPLQMTVSSDETGNAFNEPQTPTFHVTLSNITDQAQAYAIEATATHLRGEETTHEQQGSVPAGETVTVNVPLDVQRGYHDIAVTLRNGDGERLLTRRTAMALLPEDTRQHRDESPFGTWDFSGGHFTADDPDIVGPLYVKMGMRYGMFGFDVEDVKRYGIMYGNEPNVHHGVEGVRKRIDGREDMFPPYAQVFHETSISGPHSSRVPDLFHDRPAYELSEAERERFDEMWEMATDWVDQVREAYPHLRMRFGNGPIAVREEFYRQKLPADKFDAIGNEAGVFGRMPEAQPPDIVAMNPTLWMDRQLADHYGYEDKPVTLGFEVIYPNTNPGNLSYETQANYFVRHALHALAWEVEHIRPGAISDMGNSYRFSNWGSSGFTRYRPEFSVKPSFVAFATMTWVLDGANFVRLIESGSESVYALEFDRPDGSKAFALWTVRGTRPVTLRFNEGDGFKLIDDQARESELSAEDGAVTVEIGPSPVYVIAQQGELSGVELGAPDHSEAQPAGGGAVVAELNSLEGWRIVDEPNTMLEHYNDKSEPRRQGDFAFEPVDAFEGRENVLRVTPQPIDHGKATMPMYVELEHEQGLELPGEPTEIGAWVNGNSSWGRLIFELTDASGQKWISIGAAQTGDVSPWLRDWMPEEMIDSMSMAGLADWNTNDIFGYSRINFDGWRYLSMPLPGNYPGEEGARYHWPRSSQWHHDGDGVVHYPLTLRKIVVQLPEKTLHVDRFEPVSRPEVYLGPVVVGEAEPAPVRDANR